MLLTDLSINVKLKIANLFSNSASTNFKTTRSLGKYFHRFSGASLLLNFIGNTVNSKC